MSSELEDLRAERARLWAEVQAGRSHQADLRECRERVAYMEGSLSWRMTTPVRRVKRLGHNVADRLRQS